MAKAPSKKSETKIVTRIVASDTSEPKKSGSPKKAKAAKATQVAAKDTQAKEKRSRRNPFKAFLGYFSGSWYELRQVRWPDRRATWGMTGALVAFTVFFVIVIVLLDFGFAKLFDLITGK